MLAWTFKSTAGVILVPYLYYKMKKGFHISFMGNYIASSSTCSNVVYTIKILECDDICNVIVT